VRDAAADPTAADELVRRSGQMGVPVIVAGDEVIVGFDRPRLERLAERFRGRSAEALRPRLGLRVKDAPAGAEVAVVHTGSLAERAGVRVGDIVEAIDDQPVRSADDLERLVRARNNTPGLITVRRGGERRLLHLAA